MVKSKSKQAIIVKNSAMVNANGKPSSEAHILIGGIIMVHPDNVTKLIEGMRGIYGKQDFKIMNSVEYQEYLNETYPD